MAEAVVDQMADAFLNVSNEGIFMAQNGRLYTVNDPEGSIDPDDYEISGNTLFTPSGGCFGSWQTGKTMLY